jgi:4a-hydroxytetrahydrobiopterin dehydratase
MDRLDDAAIDAGLAGLEWKRSGDRLVKTMRRSGFPDAMAYVNQVAELAEAMDHHPDMGIAYDTVTFTLWTHVAGGITERDLELARRIDALG